MPNSYVKALTPTVMVFGDWAFGRSLGLAEVFMMGLVPLQEEQEREISLLGTHSGKAM